MITVVRDLPMMIVGQELRTKIVNLELWMLVAGPEVAPVMIICQSLLETLEPGHSLSHQKVRIMLFYS